MKKTTLLTVVSILLLSFLLSSCAAIGEIFKAGMGVGVFIVIVVIIVIVMIVMRIGKNKKP